MPSTVSITCRALHSLRDVQETFLLWVLVLGSLWGRPYWGMSLALPLCGWLVTGSSGCYADAFEGPSVWTLGWLGCPVEQWSLFVLFEEKKGPLRCYFFPLFFIFLVLLIAVCSERQKGEPATKITVVSNTEVVQMQDSKFQACCFTVIQLHEQQTEKQQLYL